MRIPSTLHLVPRTIQSNLFNQAGGKITCLSLKKCKFVFLKSINLMKGIPVLRILMILTGFLLVFGCAKISSPTGGPRDREIPRIVKSSPENGAINFREKDISITFNEYVVLEKINE